MTIAQTVVSGLQMDHVIAERKRSDYTSISSTLAAIRRCAIEIRQYFIAAARRISSPSATEGRCRNGCSKAHPTILG